MKSKHSFCSAARVSSTDRVGGVAVDVIIVHYHEAHGHLQARVVESPDELVQEITAQDFDFDEEGRSRRHLGQVYALYGGAVSR